MADSTIYPHLRDAWIGNTGVAWALERGGASTSGDVYDNNDTRNSYGVYSRYRSGRGANTFFIRRSFFEFDLSGESGTIASAEFKIFLDNKGTNGDPSKLIIVLCDSFDYDVSDYGNVFSSGATLGDSQSDAVQISTTAGYHTFTATAGGIARMQTKVGTSNVYFVGLMSYTYDHQNSAPPLDGSFQQAEVFYTDYASTSQDPKLELTYETAVTNNAIFFGTNF